MSEPSIVWVVAIASVGAIALGGCASGPPAPCPSPTPPVLVPLPMPATATPSEPPEPVAVLPLEENDLFRAERAELRGVLATELAKRAPSFQVLPLGDVDAKLAPLSKSARARCAFEETSLADLAEREGWLHTSVFDVHSGDGKPDQLWVEVNGSDEHWTFTAPWAPAADLMTRYKTAFASLDRNQPLAALGLLSGGVAFSKAGNGVSVCEGTGMECIADSKAWFDQSAALGKCFEGTDHASVDLLLDASASPARCEIANLDDLDGARGKRETCLCASMRASQGIARGKGRRHVSIAFDAPDLEGKPRPTVRVVEASTNLGSTREWTNVERGASVYRLSVDGADRLSTSLARCAPAGTVDVVDLTIGEAGHVDAVREVVRGAPAAATAPKDAKADAAAGACIEKALTAAAFACTEDGKPARARLELAWPAKP
ncbi:MAG: hypothetical protein U0414_40355 [Polyangiaceae bacterium]